MNQETLDKPNEVKGEKKESKVVRTALQMLQDFEIQRVEKDNRVKNAKDCYLRAMDGKPTTNKYKMPSFVLNQLTEIYSTFIRVPDAQLKAYGVNKALLVTMSKYLEKVVADGGFNSLMTNKWSGYKQQSLFGDYFVQMGYDTKKGREGMPVYRGVSSGSISTTSTAEFISPYREGNKATRFGFTVSYSRGEFEELFPKAINKAKSGNLPTLDEWTNETLGKDDNQKGKQKEFWQVLYFYDTYKKVFSIIMGANAYEYQTKKGEDYPFKLRVRNHEKEIIPVSHFGLFASPEGFYHKGLGEMFYNVVDSMTQLDSGVLKNAIDNRNAPAIINIENAEAGDVMQQIKLAKKRKEETGDNTYVVPVAATDESGRITNPVGRQSIDYLKNETDFNESQAIKARFDEEIRRFGFNLNSFFNVQDTAKQSELDIEGQNQTISKFQAQNYDSYKLVYNFALDAIIKYGDENDETLFGMDIETEDGEAIGDMMRDAGFPNITVGRVVKMFRKHKDLLEIEIDTSNGFVHNPLLERRSLQRLIEVTPQGTTAYNKLLDSLALLEGQAPAKIETPQLPQEAQPLTL